MTEDLAARSHHPPAWQTPNTGTTFKDGSAYSKTVFKAISKISLRIKAGTSKSTIYSPMPCHASSTEEGKLLLPVQKAQGAAVPRELGLGAQPGSADPAHQGVPAQTHRREH